MTYHYTNRKKVTYYLYQKPTKKGKVRYFFSQKQSAGNPVNRLPEGYEVYENPNAVVFLRKKQAPVITRDEITLIAGGGIGRCIDEICLNRALFERSGVPIVGAVINKVLHEKYDRVGPAVRQGLANQGVECLGVIPYEEELSHPTLLLIKEELSLGVLCAPERLDNRVTNIIVAAMSPQNMVEYLTSGCLVVVPGDRVDNIIASINAHLMRDRGGAPRIAGLILTGGFVPHLSIVNILCEVDVPVLLLSLIHI